MVVDLYDTIAAIATPAGTGGISVIRISGPEAIKIADNVFVGSIALAKVPSHRVLYGKIKKYQIQIPDN